MGGVRSAKRYSQKFKESGHNLKLLLRNKQ